MFKKIKWFLVSCIIFSILLFVGMRFLEHEFIKKLPAVMAELSSPVMAVQAEQIHSGHCFWQACVVAKNVRVNLLNRDVILVGDMRLAVSPFQPFSIDIKTADNAPFSVDLTLKKHRWIVRRAGGKIGTFEFQAGGWIDGLQNRGELSVQTIGLKRFLNRFMDIPVWLSFLVRDSAQKITLKPKQGMLSLFGVPLFPI